MKKQLIALSLVTAAALTFAPKPAVAGDKEWAAVGGFIGGVIIGNAIKDSHRSSCPPPRGRTTVIVNDRCDDDRDGYWKTVSVRVWVPGYWVEERGRFGRCHRYYVEGRHEYRTDRVWVSTSRRDHDDHRDHDHRR
jgi:hypothetical protein